MFWENLMDVSFVWIAIIGSILAFLFAFIKGVNRRRSR